MAPVHSPSSKVTSPLTMMALYPLARCTRRHSPPGRVVDDLADPARLDVESLELVDDHVGGRALAEHAPVPEAGGMGGQVARAGSGPPPG